MLGRTLGHYRITERVGAGGMGVVYRARDERLDRDVAIKVIPDGTFDDRSRRRFRNEARALSRTAHHAIATVHDFDTGDGIDYLVMEYIPGQTLDERLTRGEVSEQEIVQLGAQLAEGLAAAHAQGVVHGDLKPSNLRITPEGRLKILDFGLARFAPTGLETTHSATPADRPAGTLPYMAPEQVRGEEPDARSDIYAAGAVLYEMATGRRPHPERQAARLIQGILDESPPPPSTLRPALSAGLDTCLLKALDKRPAFRYQTARELLVDLQRAAAPAPVWHARTPSPRVKGWRRHARWPLAALLVAAVSVAGWVAWRARPQPAATPATAHVRLAILPAQNIAATAEPSDWPLLVQALLASELTGVDNLGVMDPLSLNGLIDHALGADPPAGGEPLNRILIDAGVTHALFAQFLAAGEALQLQANVVDPATGEIRYSTRRATSGATAVATAVAGIADDLVAFLQLSNSRLATDPDLRPWVSLARHDLRAVRAFLQAAQHLYANETEEAERYLRQALTLDPSFVAPRLWLISTLQRSGRPVEAEEHYRRLAESESRSSPFEQAMIGYARALLDGNLAAQANHLEAALVYSPGNYILIANLADARAAQGDCDEAVAALRPAITARWRYPPVYPLWGWCAVVTGQFDAAQRVLADALSIRPVSPHVFALLEALSIADGDDAAASRYATLFASRAGQVGLDVVDPAMAEAYDRLGQDRLQAQDFGRAAVLLRKAIAIGPRAPARYVDLATALRHLDEPDEAEKRCRQALEIDPDWAPAYRELGEVAARRGNPADAILHLTEYLRRQPQAPDADETRARLRELQAAAGRNHPAERRH